MLRSRLQLSSEDVARHYDELDYFYRTVWGPHVHHGLWDSPADRRGPEAATLRLLERILAPLVVGSNDLVADIGCGYGESARLVAARFHCRVEGITVSAVQAAAAARSQVTAGSVAIRLGDWMQNSFPDDSFDAAYAIESLAHMPDKARFFSEVARTLKPGARASVACWLRGPGLSPLETRLVRAICDEGRLPGLGTLDQYRRLAERSGLLVLEATDLTQQVEPTWPAIARRVLSGLLTDIRYWQFLMNRAFRERVFVLTIPRLMLAYRTGAMGYGHLVLAKPSARDGTG